MTRASLPKRAILALLTAAQIMLPAAVVVADIQSRVSGDEAAVHVAGHPEAGRGGNHPDDCVYCQFLSHAFGPTPAAIRLPALAEVLRTPATEPPAVADASSDPSARARAPPRVS
jgi:hypothetical protein